MSQRIQELTESLKKSTGASEDAVADFCEAVGGSLPDDYLEFMRASNGAIGYLVDDDGPFLRLKSLDDVLDDTVGYEVSEHIRRAVLIGTDGSEGGYIILTHKKKPEFIYSLLTNFDKKGWQRLGDCFEVFLENLWEMELAEREEREPWIRKSLKSRRPRKKKAAKKPPTPGEPGLIREIKIKAKEARILRFEGNGTILRFAWDRKKFFKMDFDSGKVVAEGRFPDETFNLSAVPPIVPFQFRTYRPNSNQAVYVSGNEWRLFDMDNSTDAIRWKMDDWDSFGPPHFSADGRQMLFTARRHVGSGETAVMIWDVEASRELKRLSAASEFGRPAEALSADGGRAVCVGQPQVYEPKDGGVPEWSWREVASEPSEIRVYDTQTDEEVHRFDIRGNHPVVFSPDGRWLAYCGHPATRIWNLETGDEQSAADKPIRKGRNCAFVPNRNWIVTTRDGVGIFVYDFIRNETVCEFTDKQASQKEMTIAPDGRVVVTWGNNRNQGPIRVWQLTD